MEAFELISIVGPTASGKTARAVHLARSIGGEIVSADSRQIYTGMDIGTGKDMEEYGSVPVHMIDIVPAGYRYNLYEYIRDASAALDDISGRGRMPVVCGGSGMYVENLLKGLVLPTVPADPEFRAQMSGHTLDELTRMLASIRPLHNSTDTDTAARAIRALEIERYYSAHPEEAALAREGKPRKALVIGVNVGREERRARISARLRFRLEQQGMVQEVQRLLDQGVPAETLLYYGLEYKFITRYLLGELSYENMVTELETAIHQFAKRQMTWFRGMERRGFNIHWLDGALNPEDFTAQILSLASA